MTHLIESNKVDKLINSKKFHKESIEILGILNIINDTEFDDGFSITNNGINYKLGNDSKIVSKIYEILK